MNDVDKKVGIYLVTSFKGGVGKSTVCANIAIQLAEKGKKVLLCDMDFDNRCLDIIMGCENSVIFDICDVIAKRTEFKSSAKKFETSGNLYFLAGPHKYRDEFTPDVFSRELCEIIKDNSIDYVVIDTAGADSLPLALVAPCADIAIVVANHDPCSLRGAERTMEKMTELGVDSRLVINSFDYSCVRKNERYGINSIIDKTKIALLGVVPYDKRLELLQETGNLCEQIHKKKLISGKAFSNIADRIISEKEGGKIPPVLSGVKKINRLKIIDK